MTNKFPIGTRVEGGEGDDYDVGTVIEAVGLDVIHPMASADNIYVAWDSGVRSWAPISDLRPIDPWNNAQPRCSR